MQQEKNRNTQNMHKCTPSNAHIHFLPGLLGEHRAASTQSANLMRRYRSLGLGPGQSDRVSPCVMGPVDGLMGAAGKPTVINHTLCSQQHGWGERRCQQAACAARLCLPSHCERLKEHRKKRTDLQYAPSCGTPTATCPRPYTQCRTCSPSRRSLLWDALG